MTRRILTYLLASSALMMAACSSNDVIEEVKPIVETKDPMRFSNVSDNYQTRTDYSIPNLLKQGFLVSSYKQFGQAGQQTVMPQYEVNYENYNSVYGPVSWNYISAESEHQFYQEQFEKYWDFSAYPYRFFAVTPAPIQNGALTSSFVLTDKQLTIPMSYEYQTCTDGKTSSGAEPCMVAEVERRDSGQDFDLLVKDDDGNYPKEINNNSGISKIRKVALPFHHLNCKVRFGIYCPTIGEGEEHTVEDVKIKVRSSNFVTSASYTANLTTSNTLMSGSFINPVTTNGTTLIEVTDGAYQTGNCLDHLETEPDVVYWFECENGLMQIPQEGVKISISFKVKGKFLDESIEQIAKDFDGEYTVFEDVPIILKDKNPKQEVFDWEKNMFYTYYIILGEFTTTTPQFPIGGDYDRGPIEFTCVVEPWEDIVGSTDTSLED